MIFITKLNDERGKTPNYGQPVLVSQCPLYDNCFDIVGFETQYNGQPWSFKREYFAEPINFALFNSWNDSERVLAQANKDNQKVFSLTEEF